VITDMRVPNLLGLTLKHRELEISSDIIAQPVFHKQVLPPGANVIKLLRYFFMVNYRGKKALLFLGLKYRGNLLSNCNNLPSFQAKFNAINIPMVI
jgi:hypothetical protein